MTKIKLMVDEIDEEIEGAKNYAEKYLEYKAKGNVGNYPKFRDMYKEMASDELKHTDYLHTIASQEIDELRKVYTPPVEMEDAWNESHKRYVEKVAWIKQMLAM